METLQAVVNAFLVGIKDSLNPFSLTTFIALFLVLSRLGVSGQRILGFSLPYIFIVFLFSFLATFGLFDTFLFHPTMTRIFYMIYSLIGFLLVGVGGKLFFEWLWYAKSHDERFLLKSTPLFLPTPAPEKALTAGPKFLRFLFSVSLGGVMAVLSSTWGQNLQVYLSFYSLVNAGETQLSLAAIFVYCVGYVFILVVLAAIAYLTMASEPMKRWVRRYFSLLKIMSSAFVLSMGIGLIYLTI